MGHMKGASAQIKFLEIPEDFLHRRESGCKQRSRVTGRRENRDVKYSHSLNFGQLRGNLLEIIVITCPCVRRLERIVVVDLEILDKVREIWRLPDDLERALAISSPVDAESGKEPFASEGEQSRADKRAGLNHEDPIPCYVPCMK